MKSNEFITESEMRELTFGELGQARKPVDMGELTDAIGEFLDRKNVVVHRVGFNSVVRVTSVAPDSIRYAHEAFSKFFKVSDINDASQGQYGFSFSVAHMDPAAYAEDLENTLRYWDFTKK